MAKHDYVLYNGLRSSFNISTTLPSFHFIYTWKFARELKIAPAVGYNRMLDPFFMATFCADSVYARVRNNTYQLLYRAREIVFGHISKH